MKTERLPVTSIKIHPTLLEAIDHARNPKGEEFAPSRSMFILAAVEQHLKGRRLPPAIRTKLDSLQVSKNILPHGRFVRTK